MRRFLTLVMTLVAFAVASTAFIPPLRSNERMVCAPLSAIPGGLTPHPMVTLLPNRLPSAEGPRTPGVVQDGRLCYEAPVQIASWPANVDGIWVDMAQTTVTTP